MGTIRKLILAILASAILLSGQSTIIGMPGFGEVPPRLSGLRIGDAVKIDYISEGCFHRMHYTFTIDGDKPSVLTIKGVPSTAKETSEIQFFKQVDLTELDTQAIDRLLSFYRSASEGGCTTVDRINVAWTMRNHWNYGESFIDATCTQGTLAEILIRSGAWP